MYHTVVAFAFAICWLKNADKIINLLVNWICFVFLYNAPLCILISLTGFLLDGFHINVSQNATCANLTV